VPNISQVDDMRPCILTNNCSCDNLYESDCFCASPNVDNVQNDSCDCDVFENECWDYHSSISKYDKNCEFSMYKNVKIRVIIRSKDWESIMLMRAFKHVLEAAGGSIDFKFLFSAEEDDNTKYGFKVENGNDEEILVDIMQTCIEYFYPKYEQYFPVLQCINSASTLSGINEKTNTIMYFRSWP